MNLMSKTLAVCLLAASPACVTGVATAAPLGAPLGLRDASPDQTAPLEAVQWRGHWGGHGWGGGWGGHGWGPGFAAGAIVGGALAASPWYGNDYYDYDSGPGYYSYGYDPGYTAYRYSAPNYASGGAAYCAQRYRSYDPASGTYLGFDGLRHPCP
jgi:BA14K-like protein